MISTLANGVPSRHGATVTANPAARSTAAASAGGRGLTTAPA